MGYFLQVCSYIFLISEWGSLHCSVSSQYIRNNVASTAFCNISRILCIGELYNPAPWRSSNAFDVSIWKLFLIFPSIGSYPCKVTCRSPNVGKKPYEESGTISLHFFIWFITSSFSIANHCWVRSATSTSSHVAVAEIFFVLISRWLIEKCFALWWMESSGIEGNVLRITFENLLLSISSKSPNRSKQAI